MSFFDKVYEGIPDWDIGRPQREFVRLEEAGEIRGSVLDAGCGTGEIALFLASRGHEVLGIDSSSVAIAKAKEKAGRRELDIEFRVHDALELWRLGRQFDTVIDSGLFHVFSDEERPLFVKSLASVLKAEGTYLMMCFSNREPRGWGPRRISERRIRLTFDTGWNIEYIRPALFEANRPGGTAEAWLVSVRKQKTK